MTDKKEKKVEKIKATEKEKKVIDKSIGDTNIEKEEKEENPLLEIEQQASKNVTEEIRYLTPIKIYKKQVKFCRFKKNNIKHIDYKDTDLLMQMLNEQGEIIPRRYSGTSLKYQRKLATAVKRARQLALLPYVCDFVK